MKNMKKLFSLALALVMMMALVVTAGAQTVTYDGPDAGTGSLTISNAVNGETYEIYKLFDAELNADGSGVIYPSDTQTIPKSLKDYFVVDSENPNTIKATFTEYNDTILEALKAWTVGKTALKSAESDGTALKFDKIPFGYYVVVSRSGNSNGGAISVDSTRPNVVLNDKNTSGNIPEFPTDGKEVTKINGVAVADKNANNVKVGDTVEYTVKYETKNFVSASEGQAATEQVKEYVLTDVKPEFLEAFDVTSVTIGGVAQNPVPEFDQNGKMTFKWADKTDEVICTNEDTEHEHGDACYKWNSRYANGAEIVITYEAVVNEKVIGAEKKTNTVSATYTTVSGNGGGNGGTTEEDIYSYNFELAKTAGDTSTLLANAKFDLYDAKTGGNQISLVKVNDNTWRVATAAEQAVAGFKSDEIVTNANSVITIQGLSNGDYFLEETEAPSGYNQLKERTKAVNIDGADSKIAFNDVTAKWEGKGIQVINNTGTELPSTGGIGTTIFTVTGALLMIGAAILFLTKKRSEA